MHLVFQNIQAVIFDEISPTDDRDIVTVPSVESAINWPTASEAGTLKT